MSFVVFMFYFGVLPKIYSKSDNTNLYHRDTWTQFEAWILIVKVIILSDKNNINLNKLISTNIYCNYIIKMSIITFMERKHLIKSQFHI